MTQQKLDRVYHQWNTWEEVAFNMWGATKNKQAALELAKAFTECHSVYGAYMRRVALEWPVSCENALTDHALNKRAWIGHAAVAMALGIPEDITREAWGLLTDEQRLLANKEATRAIALWEIGYRKSRGICTDMGAQVLLEWDTR